ncbi:MAG: ribonuclease HI family protein [Synergistetes bacterium]|nr:ribonuclease HI family protein [Synergistota bacterium]MCX8127504.1 ribonuclease HI family protein [Synergistota bacterium]MDW8191580.1 ribonuclease HI family protein [Synergistota bacterium]
MKVRIFTDGASQGNPGEASVGISLEYDEEGRAIKEKYGFYIGEATNNVAEYLALVCALRLAKEKGADEVEVFVDSELVYKQILGVYIVRSQKLQGLFKEAKELLESFQRFSIYHLPRRMNKEADTLANMALKLYRMAKVRA